MSISVSFDGQSQNIIIQNNNNSQQISVNINTLNLGANVLDKQKKMRLADSRKDCIHVKATSKVTNIQIMDQILQTIYNTSLGSTTNDAHINYIHSLTDSVSSDNAPLIRPRIFLKSDTISSAYYDIRACMAESGLGVDKWAKKRQPPDEIIILGTLSASLDPASRVSPTSIWNSPGGDCSFDASILSGLFGFPQGTSWKSTSISNDSFQYDISVKDGISISGEANFKTIVNPNDQKYIKGNDTKNKIINFLKVATPTDDVFKYVILKEMGDVMQVLQFFVWCNINVGEGKSYSYEEVLIYTTDSVVYTLCQMLKLPVLYTGQPSGQSGYCKAYQYVPTVLDYAVIINKTITQAYERIYSHNSNIKFVLNRIQFELDKLHYIDDSRRTPRLVPCNISIRSPAFKDAFSQIVSGFSQQIDSFNRIAEQYRDAEIARITQLFVSGTSTDEINSQMNIASNYITNNFFHPVIIVTEYLASDSLAENPRQSKIVRSYTLTGDFAERFKVINTSVSGGAIVRSPGNNSFVVKSIPSQPSFKKRPNIMPIPIIQKYSLNDILKNIGIGHYEFVTIKILYRVLKNIYDWNFKNIQKNDGVVDDVDASIIEILPVVYSQFVYYIIKFDTISQYDSDRIVYEAIMASSGVFPAFKSSVISDPAFQTQVAREIVSIKQQEVAYYSEFSIDDDYTMINEVDKNFINIIGMAGFKFATPEDDVNGQKIQPAQYLQILANRPTEIFSNAFSNPFAASAPAVTGGILKNKTVKRKNKRTRKNKSKGKKTKKFVE